MRLTAAVLALTVFCAIAGADAPPATQPHAVLVLPGSGTDETKIDYAALPLLSGTHAVVCPPTEDWKFQLHNYLAHFDGKYWCMWSHGPVVEDVPTQHIRYATSDDGVRWSEAKVLVGPPAEGYAYIARGLWERNGELLALAAHFKGKGAFGVDKELQLKVFGWDKDAGEWKPRGVAFDNAINNFPPQKLPTGEWMMTRRDARFNVSVLVGGRKGIDDWQSFPVSERTAVKGFSPDEPIWWALDDGRLIGLFRDNGGSSRLFRAFSADNGRTWTRPSITNFPNSTSKIFSLRTRAGYRVMISNANPKLGRREMHLSISEDGETFTRLAKLDIPSPKATTFQYPHAIERDGHLLIAFSQKKQRTEVLKVPMSEIEKLRK